MSCGDKCKCSAEPGFAEGYKRGLIDAARVLLDMAAAYDTIGANTALRDVTRVAVAKINQLIREAR